MTVRAGQATPLKIPEDKEIDFVLVRESTEGLFFTQGTGEVSANEARETLRITRDISEKLFRFTFDLAHQRKAQGRGPGRVTCVDKANVFRAFAFFRELFDAEAAKHPSLTADHAYVDATALWMVQKPWDFDVLVTENMFGDILSDLGAGLMGGLGLAPSADIGLDHAVFQPCHGSAPDIAGRGVANTIGPGKLARWSVSPTMVFDEAGRLALLAGSPGGSRIINYTAQSIANVLLFGMTPAEAVAVPHIVSRNNGRIEVENSQGDTALAEQLRSRGLNVVEGEQTSGLHLIRVTDDGLIVGADPRREGHVLGDSSD